MQHPWSCSPATKASKQHPWCSAGGAVELRRSVGAVLELGRSCNEASSESLELYRGCNGARPELQWSSPEGRCCAGAPSGCNGAHQRPSVLRWSFPRGCNGAALKLSLSLLPIVIQRLPACSSDG
ncbi:hypothetical protein VPH35_072203 [Triticum aestivum]